MEVICVAVRLKLEHRKLASSLLSGSNGGLFKVQLHGSMHVRFDPFLSTKHDTQIDMICMHACFSSLVAE